MTTPFPSSVSQYLLAVEAGDLEGSLRCFAPDAVVVDEGRSHRGDEIRAWQTRSESEYTFTREFLGLAVIDGSHFVASFRLEGDFPGGIVDLRFDFRLAPDGRIERLEIAP